jgi:hypothetical protein
VTLLKEVLGKPDQIKADNKFSLIEKFLAEGHAGNYWVITAKRRSALGKRSNREDDNEGGGVMRQMGSSSYKRPNYD